MCLSYNFFFVTGVCVDTVGWLNRPVGFQSGGYGCAAYATNGWCANGDFVTGFEWAGKFNGPGIL